MKKEIKKRLFALADEKYKKFHSNLCPGVDNIIGVRVPVLRQYAKDLKKEYKVARLLKQIDNQYYEEIMLQGMLIGLAKKEDINIILQFVEKYVPKIDNWAICDVFFAGLKITQKYKKQVWEFIQKYIKSEKEFEVRFAIVMILDYFIDEQYLQKDFQIFDSIKHEGYYVKMAVAWAISVCIVKYYEETIQYLEKAQIDNWTYNKAIQKSIESYRIIEAQKQNLRKMKK